MSPYFIKPSAYYFSHKDEVNSKFYWHNINSPKEGIYKEIEVSRTSSIIHTTL